MIAVLVFGFVAISALMMTMKVVGLDVGLILALTILSFLIMLLVEGVIIWQLLRLNRGAGKTRDAELSEEQVSKEIYAAQMRVLPEAMPSVTEHTTRTLDPIYREQKPK
jgi:heme/copper-type cytochrome/quinol oxidase subunit 2